MAAKPSSAAGLETSSACPGKFVPAVLRAMLQDPDPGKSKRVMGGHAEDDQMDIKLLTQAHL